MYCGTDIVQVSRIQALAERHAASLPRFFTDQELAYCRKKDGTYRYESLAAIFAAKEALFKALGTGFRKGTWKDVEVCHDELGAPFFRFTGYYQAAVAKRAVQTPSLSLAHDGGYALAFVLL